MMNLGATRLDFDDNKDDGSYSDNSECHSAADDESFSYHSYSDDRSLDDICS